ncbi:hypothetical protein LguiB_020743 [Lonicera macranthoides]
MALVVHHCCGWRISIKGKESHCQRICLIMLVVFTCVAVTSNWTLKSQTRVLKASLHHVIGLGWTEAAMIAGARKAGVSPIVGSFPRKEGALVELAVDQSTE